MASLTRSGFRVASLLEQELTGRLATVRLSLERVPATTAVVDLLFASSGIEPEVVAAATLVAITPRLRLPVATIGHLLAMKVLSRNDDTRPQDIIDLRNLILEATPEDLDVARAALTLITERGYDRGKSLQTDLDGLLSRFLPTR